MSKPYSRASKLRQKRLAQDMPGLAETPKRGKVKRGRARMNELPKEREGEAQSTMLTARAKIMGLPASKAQDMKSTYSGSDAGRCIAHGKSHQQAMRLWDVWQGYCQAHRTYRLRYIGQSEDPKGASLAVSPEPMEADQSHSVDLRDTDERDRDAVRNWMKFEGLLMRLERRHMAAINAARTAPEGEMWSDTAPTIRGYAFAEAISALANEMGV